MQPMCLKDHVYLRALKPGDGQKLDGISDTAFRFTTGPIPPIPDPTRRDHHAGSPVHQFSFAIMAGDRLVGEVIFSGLDMASRSLRLTMGIARQSDRRQGMGGQALQLALTYSFYSLGMLRITADTTDANPAAMASLIKGGFRLTGSERSPSGQAGQPVRRLHYAITLDAFNALKKKAQQSEDKGA